MQVRRKDKTDPAELRCKIVLVLLLAVGLALIAGGLWGIGKYNSSGFDTEAGFMYIQELEGSLDKLYSGELKGELDALESETAEKLTQMGYELLVHNWSGEAGEDRRATADESLEGLEGEKYSEKVWKLLSLSYSVTGPKISNSQLKAVKALSKEEKEAFRAELVDCILDENKELSEIAAEVCKKTKGMDTTAALMQLWLTTGSDSYEPLPTDYTNGLKKAVRKADARINAYQMTVDGDINFFTQLCLSHSKTIILIGILFSADLLLLIIMMAKDHNWTMDYKWVLIFLIVDFLVVFQVLPLVYLVIKAFFPDGKFTFEVFRRLYTYPMNLSALKNTLIAAGTAMVLGTILAFPLAWLVGRTNLYGRKFFRSLFVMTYMVPPYVGAMAWLRLLNPNVGTINKVIRFLFAMGDAPGPLNI